MEVKKAIIPAAGMGTRFLPATKAVPKEMLPILNKPAIQYIVEEGIRANIKNFVLVTNKYKQSIEDHFDKYAELDQALSSGDKTDLLGNLPKLIEQVDFTSVRQRQPLGLGHAIWTARHTVGKEHIAVLLPDDIIEGPSPAIGQLIKIAAQEKANVVAVQEVPFDMISRYGVIAVKKQFSPTLFQVKELVEKPSPSNAPSNLAIIGRYILSSNIFQALEQVSTGSAGEIQLTDGIQQLLLDGEKVFAYKIQGVRHDTGTPMGWLKANIAMGLTSQEYSEEIMSYLKELDKEFVVMQSKAAQLSKKEREFSF